MGKKAEFIGYIVPTYDVGDTFQTHLARLPDAGVDDSYHQQATPFYIHAFDGCKKIRITVEEI